MILILPFTLALFASLWLGYQLRYDFNVPPDVQRGFLFIAPWVILLKLLFLMFFRQYRAWLGSFSKPDFNRLATALFLATVITFIISTHTGSDYAPPRSVVLTDFSFSLLALSGVRLCFRRFSNRGCPQKGSNTKRARRAGIIGAGLVGTALAQEFATRRDLGLRAVAFFDDDANKAGSRLHDIPVIGPPEQLLNAQADLELEEVVIAMPSAPAKRIREIIKILQEAQIKFTTVPSIYELSTGRSQVTQLRAVQVEDLLGRDPVELETENICELLHGKRVMVTGSGGSIGSELCRQILSYRPETLLMVEQSEAQLFQIEQELLGRGARDNVVPLVADILDSQRMNYLFRHFRPEVIFHSAAHKHVPMMESQPGEAIKNNAVGTYQLAEIAIKHDVERFVLISSDKAINPTNVMGATKRLAEICIQSLHAAHSNKTKFMAVRFGNVMGSSGSVIPIFEKQIAAGGPVNVTHPDVTRYFMTIAEAAGLVLQSAAQGTGGEVFVLDMGKPVKIADLARQMIELSGLNPDVDVPIRFTGLRPGEKLFEELCYEGENILPTHHPKIMRFISEPIPLKQTREMLRLLTSELDDASPSQLKLLLKGAVPEYQPQIQKKPSESSRPSDTRRVPTFAGSPA
jgi:FlaA1/EpsC-like NDP-sugar epimerase